MKRYLIIGIAIGVLFLVTYGVISIGKSRARRQALSVRPQTGSVGRGNQSKLTLPPGKRTFSPPAKKVPEKPKTKPGPATLRATVKPYYQSSIFPPGVESQVRMVWENVGVGSALEASSFAKIYYWPREHSEDGVIREWQSEFEAHLKFHRFAREDRVTLNPTDPKNPPLEIAAMGPLLTFEHSVRVTAVKERIFVVGAVRFKDSLGWHEAHTCNYVSIFVLSDLSPGQHYGMRFVNCKEYNSQVDVKP